jgi:PAS domain S-box-containing protein
VVVEDITERQQAEGLLREALVFNRAVVDASPVGILTYKASGECVSANGSAAALTGGTVEMLRAQNFRELDSWRRSGLLQAAEEALRSGTLVKREIHVITTFGKEVWYEAQFLRFATAGESHLLLMLYDLLERKTFEAALQASRAHYEGLFENSPVPTWEEDFSSVHTRLKELGLLGQEARALADYFAQHAAAFRDCVARVRILGVNRQCLALHAATDKAHLLAGLPRLVTEESRAALLLQLAAIATGQTELETESKVRTLDGRRRDVQVRWVAMPGHEHTYGRVLVTTEDITERKQAEAALQASEERFRTLASLAPAGIYQTDAAGRCQYANPRWCEMAGLPMAEVLGDGWTNGLHPEDRSTIIACWQRMVESQGHWGLEYRFHTPDGKISWVYGLAAPLRDAANNVTGYIGINLDITERKAAEEALRASEERLRLALDAAQMGTFDWDVPGNRITWSHWHEELWGFKPGEFGGTYEAFAGRVHPEDLPGINAEVAHCIVARARWMREFRVVWPDGSVHWILGQGEFSFDAAGRPQRMRGVVKEITDRKQLEAERAEAMTRLAVVEEQERHRLSRDLHDQTAQRLVALAVELKNLETNLAAGRPQGERVRLLRKAVDELQQQVRQIPWNLRAGDLVDGDLASAVWEYVEDWSERARVPVDCECRGLGGGRLPGSVEATLYRVAQEALANVEKHAQARRVSVLLEREGALVRLTVEDDGRGFDPEAVQQLPGAAQRLGLLGIRERVALARGTFLIESSPGAGTTILVRIPIPTAGRPA